jgi:hypothetical protein
MGQVVSTGCNVEQKRIPSANLAAIHSSLNGVSEMGIERQVHNHGLRKQSAAGSTLGQENR